MWKLTALIVKRFWGLCAFLLISLALLVALGRELAPQLANYRAELESHISELAGAEVSIGAVHAFWQGLSPQLEFRDLVVQGRDGETLFFVDRVQTRLNLLQSLLDRQLILDNLRFSQLTMGFVQSPDGSWSLRGVDPEASSSGGLDLSGPLDIFLTASHIEVRDAQLSFDFRTGHHTELSLPSAILENQGSFHRLHSELAVDGGQDVLRLIIEAQGDPRSSETFQAQGYLRLRDFDLDRIMAALPGDLWQGLPGQAWREDSRLDLDLWLDVTPGMQIYTRGLVKVGELPLALEHIQTPLRTSARFAGYWDEFSAWKLALRDLSLVMEDVDLPALDVQLSSEDLDTPVQVQIAELDLEPWTAAIRESGLLEGWALDALRELNPRGQLRNATFSLAGTALEDITIRANLHQVYLDSWQGAPAVEQLDGYVETKPLAGFVDIASEHGFSMHYPTIYHEPLTFDSARGQVHWQVDLEGKAVDVHSGLLALEGPMGLAHGYFSLHIPTEKGESRDDELILQIGLQNSNTRYHTQFVPYILPGPLLDWLEQSIGEGELRSGGFLYRGGLRSETAAHAAIQLFLNIAEGELSYHRDWPAVEAAFGTVWLDNQTVSAELESARIFNTQVERGQIKVHVNHEGGSPMLEIEAAARGDAADGLRFLRETPLQSVVGGQWLEAWQLQGDLRSAISIAVPLDAEQAPSIHQLDLNLANTLASNPDLNLEFAAVAGRLSYNDDRGLYSDALHGTLWGRAVEVEVSEIQGEYRALNVTMTGQMDVASVQDWSGRPELAFAAGEALAAADLFVPISGGADVPPRLTIRSDLEGVNIDLPAPFGKAEGETRAMELGLSLKSDANLLELRYQDLLHAVFELDDGTLARGGIQLGGNAQLPERGHLQLSGSMAYLKVDEWTQVWARYQEAQSQQEGAAGMGAHGSGPSLRSGFELSLASAVFAGFELDNLNLRGEELVDRWQISLDSHRLGGEVSLYRDASMPALLNLSHLHLADFESDGSSDILDQEQDLLADFDPRTLPALDVNLDSVNIGDTDFGSWSFQLRPTEEGVIARRITGSVKGGHILGLTEGEGAQLEWQAGNGPAISHFQGRFVTDDLGSVLEQWGQPRLLDSESSWFEVDLRWPGSPAAIGVVNLQGSVDLSVQRGSFVRGAGESAQARAGGALLELISFFNFDTWLRRIRVDFSDLRRSGMAFQSIRGVLHFDDGRVMMDDPVVVSSFSSRFQMAGVVNLLDSSLDTRLVATIPVGGNLTFMAALAGFGLPGVAGMWLISKVFEEQIDKVSSLSFDVSGSLQEPKMRFVRFFDHEAVHEATRAELDPQ